VVFLQKPSSSAVEFSKTIFTSCSENLNEGGMPIDMPADPQIEMIRQTSLYILLGTVLQGTWLQVG
jgi:hypothetical protein